MKDWANVLRLVPSLMKPGLKPAAIELRDHGYHQTTAAHQTDKSKSPQNVPKSVQTMFEV